MSARGLWIVILFAVLGAGSGVTLGQDSSAEASGAGPGRKQFDEVFSKWKQLLKELRELRETYKIAEEEKAESIRNSFKQKIADGENMVPELEAASLAAYNEQPNVDRELSRFIINLAADQIRKDNYSRAKELLEPLVAHACEERELHNLMGITAYGTNDFETAEKQLNEAQKAGTLSEQGQAALAGLPDVLATWPRELELREKEAQADDLPRVKLETTAGDITLELFENEAPETVGNFISLVEKGFYDGLKFHRVLQGFMAQGGCPKGDGTGGPGYRIYCECINDNHRSHFAGSLSMAKEVARHTGGSQFFITFVPTPSLNGQHTVFGRVIEGMDRLPLIVKQDPEARSPQPSPTQIIKATVLRKRAHEYLPNKVK